MFLLSMIILGFFAIIGLCTFITAILDAVCKSEGNAELILKDLRPDNAEIRIRSAARICHRHRGISLKCVCKEDDPAYDICLLMRQEYPFLEILQPESPS